MSPTLEQQIAEAGACLGPVYTSVLFNPVEDATRREIRRLTGLAMRCPVYFKIEAPLANPGWQRETIAGILDQLEVEPWRR